MEKELLGLDLPINTWKELFYLAEQEDRLPSDYLRRLIDREARKLANPEQAPAPICPNLETVFA